MPFNFLEAFQSVSQFCQHHAIPMEPNLLIVSIRTQRMALLSQGQVSCIYAISTSRNPPSCQAESFGTPTGLHRIAETIGADAPMGMVFKGRIPTGRLYHEMTESEQTANLITSRILRLRGLEAGKNAGAGCDSFDRYIYIHGTNHEGRIGEPFSGGCIELRNSDVIQLFNSLRGNELVYISNE